MHSTRRESLRATDSELLSSKPVDEPTYSKALKKNFIEENISQAKVSKIFSSKPVETSTSRIENRKVYFNKKVSDIWEFGATPLQKETPTASGSTEDIFQSSTLVAEVTRRLENFPSIEKMSPFTTHAMNESISKDKMEPRADFDNRPLSHASSTEETVENYLSCRQNVVELVRNDSLSNEQIGNGSTVIEIPYRKHRENSKRKDERTSTSGPRKLGLENLLSSIKTYESCNTGKPLLNKHKIEIENVLPLEKSDANYLQAENSNIKVYPFPNDVSFKYKQIYYEKNPCVYDFTIKLMAHIEFLNDKSWKRTHSYFNYDVQKTVEYLWNKVKEFRIEFQTIDSDKLKQLLLEFSMLCQRKIFKLMEFLGCCILMCQIGVEARKRKFKEFPVLVITLLRERIKEFENSHRNCIDPIVENIAEKLAQLV